MSDNSKIEWTDASWNPVTGCTKVSAGCDNCYAETFAERWRGTPGHHFEHGFDITLRPERLDQPRRWKRPRRIFVNSVSDLFHDAIPDDFIDSVFAVMGDCPWHTFQVLSKRHARMRAYLRRAWPEPLPNVWVGVSAEDQHWAGIRVHALLGTPAAVRWVSAEPLLGPVDLRNLKASNGALIDALCGDVKSPDGTIYAACPGSVSWVVAGGESGAKARPMHPDWARSLRDQCQQTKTPFLFKQWGAHRWITGSRYDEETQCWVDHGIEPQRVPRKLSGRELRRPDVGRVSPARLGGCGMTAHGTHHLDPRWQELQNWAQRLYTELGPGDTLCAVVLLVHGQGGESVTYLTDSSGTVSQTVITPDGTCLRVPDSVTPGGAG